MAFGDFSLAPTGSRLPQLEWADHCQISDIVALYGRLYDDGRIDDFMGLFTPDAIFHPNWPGVAPDRVVGTADLTSFFAAARAGSTTQGVMPRHATTNVLIRATGAGRAEATLSMLYTESRGSEVMVRMVGQYDFSFVRIDGRWFIDQWSMRYDK